MANHPWESDPVVGGEKPPWESDPAVTTAAPPATGQEIPTFAPQTVTPEAPPARPDYFLAKAGIQPSEASAMAPAQASEITRNTIAGAEDVAKGFVLGVPKALPDILFPERRAAAEIGRTIGTVGQVIRGAVPLQETIATQYPESQQIPEAEKTPAFSRERFEAGFGMLANLLQIGAGLRGAIPELRPEIPLRPTPEPPPTVSLGPGTIAGDVSRALERRFTMVPAPPEPAPVVQPAPPLEPTLERLGQREFGRVTAEGVVPPPPPAEPLPAETARIQPRGGELSATQERQITEGVPIQRPGDVQGRPPVEAGVGGGVQPAAEIGRPPAPEEAAVAPPAEAAAREAPPVQPPAEAPPTAAAPQPDTVTGIANKVTQQERAARGIPEATEPGRRSWQQAMDEAQARDAEGPNLVAELKNNPRALSDTEDALVLREQIKAQQAHQDAIRQVNADPSDLAAKTRLEAARDRLQMIYDLDKSVGTVAGRGFNARKMLADQDFTLARMEAEIRAEGNGGKPLTEKQASEIGKIHDKIQKTEEAYQKQIRKGIEEYKRRTGEKDVSPLRPPRRVATDPETIRLLRARDNARSAYHEMLGNERFNAAPLYRKIGHYASDIGVGLSRSIKSAFDLSGLLRQGGLIVAGRPITGAKAIGPMLKAFASEEAQTAAMQDIVSSAKYDRMRNSKLEITEPGGRMSSREEVFRSSLAEHIPGVPASERAYTTVLNKLRSDSFNAMTGLAEKLTGRKLTPGEDKIISNYINIASGRGAMGRFAPAANALSKVFWSPRLAVSRVQYLAGQPIWGNLKAGGAPAVRALIAAEYGRTLTGAAVMVGLAKAAGADVEMDPRSGNFGIRFGNTRIDITAGLKSYINFFSRIITNKIKTQRGEIKTLGQDVVTPKAGELTWKMLRGKLAPAYGSGFNVLEHEQPTGQPTTLMNELLGFYAPLSPQDVADALQTQGIPQKTALSLLAIGGMSVQNYEHMSAADKNAIRARLQQRDQALMRGDVNQAWRLSLPSTKPAGSPTVTKVMR